MSRIDEENNKLKFKNKFLEDELNKYKKIVDDDFYFIKSIASISIAQICSDLGINRTSVMSNRCKKEDLHRVKVEIEKCIADAFYGEK